MNRILVTTDFSTNSKAGLRFAIQLSKQRQDTELIFLYVDQEIDEEAWPEIDYSSYAKEEQGAIVSKLERFVKSVYRSMKVDPVKYKCAVYGHFNVVDGILSFAKKNKCSYICISTHGAGTIARIFGTNTGKLITHSDVPVLCIPKSWRVKSVRHLLYASDMQQYQKELKEVLQFARPINASVEILHIFKFFDNIANKKELESNIEKKFAYSVTLHVEKRDFENSMLKDMELIIGKINPSVVVFFTQQRRSFFERLFISNKTKILSFHTKVPMLVFNKIK